MSIWRSYVVPQWVDEYGTTFRPYCTTFPQFEADLSPYTGLLAAMANMSACALQAGIVQSAHVYTSSGGTSSFPTAQDKLLIQVGNDDGTSFIAIPGPLDSVMVPGTKVMDMSSPLVSALQDQVTAVLGDGQGSRWTRIIGGLRTRVTFGNGTNK